MFVGSISALTGWGAYNVARIVPSFVGALEGLATGTVLELAKQITSTLGAMGSLARNVLYLAGMAFAAGAAIGALQADPAHVPNPTATEVPSEVRHLRRVNGADGGQGEA